MIQTREGEEAFYKVKINTSKGMNREERSHPLCVEQGQVKKSNVDGSHLLGASHMPAQTLRRLSLQPLQPSHRVRIFFSHFTMGRNNIPKITEL